MITRWCVVSGPDWWDFATREEARTFFRDMREDYPTDTRLVDRNLEPHQACGSSTCHHPHRKLV